jgi:Flp pilus assembly protein CpaB
MSYRTRNILMATGLAIAAAVFMLIYASNARDGGDDLGNALVRVLVAGRDIDQGTPGSALTGDALVEKRIPQKAVVPDAIASPNQVRGLVATEETLAGEQITLRRFGSLKATGVLAQINRRQRAVQLAGDPNQVLDGTLKPGDQVDVMATWSWPVDCEKCRVVRTIVRDARVLATSAELPSLGNSAPDDSKAVQLRLTGRQAERVFWMEKNGDWWLVLRPVVKPRSSPQEVQTAGTILVERGD